MYHNDRWQVKKSLTNLSDARFLKFKNSGYFNSKLRQFIFLNILCQRFMCTEKGTKAGWLRIQSILV